MDEGERWALQACRTVIDYCALRSSEERDRKELPISSLSSDAANPRTPQSLGCPRLALRGLAAGAYGTHTPTNTSSV